jgi:hypothetical protein
MYKMRYIQTYDQRIEYREAVPNPRFCVFGWLAKQGEHANGLILYILPLSAIKCPRSGGTCGCAAKGRSDSGSRQYQQQDLQKWREVFQMLSAVPKLRICVILPQQVDYGCPGVIACLKECLEEHSDIIWQVRTATDYRGYTGQTVFVDVLLQLVPTSIRSLDYILHGSCRSIGALSSLTGLTQVSLRGQAQELHEILCQDVWGTLAALTNLQELTCENMNLHGLLSSVPGMTRLTALRITANNTRWVGGGFVGSLTSLSTLHQLKVNCTLRGKSFAAPLPLWRVWRG